MCWLCEASKGNDGDLDMALSNVARDASWWATMLTTDPWETRPAYAGIIGFHLSQIVPDLLHVWNLGVSRELIGSSLKQILKTRTVFHGSNLDIRLEEASASLRSYAKQHRLQLAVRKLTKGKLCWKAESFPSFAAKGYDAYVAGLWLEDLLRPHGEEFADLFTLFWSSNRALSIMYGAGFHLSEEQLDSVKGLGQVFLDTYARLAKAANQNGEFLFKLQPKFHMLQHVWVPSRTVNQSRYSTWMDEDFLRKISRTLELTSSRTAHRRVLERWLMSLPEHLQTHVHFLARGSTQYARR